MSQLANHIVFAGQVSELEAVNLQSGRAVYDLRLTQARTFTKADGTSGREETHFAVKAYLTTAQTALDALLAEDADGCVEATGRLRLRTWTDRDSGKERSFPYLEATTFTRAVAKADAAPAPKGPAGSRRAFVGGRWVTVEADTAPKAATPAAAPGKPARSRKPAGTPAAE